MLHEISVQPGFKKERMQFYPSLMAADLLNLKKELQLLDPHVPGYHIDIMDFHFVPNMTFGPAMVNALRKATEKPFSVHLMVEYSEQYFDRLELKKGDVVSIHPEAPSELSIEKLIQLIADKGWTPSIALNPATDVSILKGLPVNHILVMSVNPGFSGQEFMPVVFGKLQKLQQYITAVDGGVSKENARQLLDAGADQLVVGSALFKTGNPLKELQILRDAINN